VKARNLPVNGKKAQRRSGLRAQRKEYEGENGRGGEWEIGAVEPLRRCAVEPLSR